MKPIAEIGATIRVTPLDDLQLIEGPNSSTFINDRTPFSLVVDNLIYDGSLLMGVSGPVIEGHPRYQDQIATLLVRLDDSDWSRETSSHAGFKVGKVAAKWVGGVPSCHPSSTVMSSYPFIARFGEISTLD